MAELAPLSGVTSSGLFDTAVDCQGHGTVTVEAFLAAYSLGTVEVDCAAP